MTRIKKPPRGWLLYLLVGAGVETSNPEDTTEQFFQTLEHWNTELNRLEFYQRSADRGSKS